MLKIIDLKSYQKKQVKKTVGKPHFLRPKDLLKAFSQQNVIVGQTPRGVFVFVATLTKSSDNVTIILMAYDGDPMVIKSTFESVFLSNDVVVSEEEMAPDIVDLRPFAANGTFSGKWFFDRPDTSQGGGLSFMIMSDAGYQTLFSTTNEAFRTFTKILELAKKG